MTARDHQSPVFSTYHWVESWWKSFGDGATPLVIALREDGELRALAPLMRHEDRITFIGGRAVSDYLGFVGDCRPALIDALGGVLAAWDWRIVCLRGFRHDSTAPTLLVKMAEKAGWSATLTTEDVCPVVELPHDWNSYLARLSKKDRHELRRKLRRLDTRGNWRWYVQTDPTTRETDVDEFLRLLCASSVEKACFLDERMAAFFRASLGPLLAEGTARLYFLEVDGQRVSATICFDQPDELWLYNSGFDPAYSDLSVGLLLKALCVQDAIALGKKRFDFLRGQEPYKYDLGGSDEPVYTVTITRAPSETTPPCRFLDEPQDQ